MIKSFIAIIVAGMLSGCSGPRSISEYRDTTPLVFTRTIALDINQTHENLSGMLRKCFGTSRIGSDFYGDRSSLSVQTPMQVVLAVIDLKKIDNKTTLLTAPVPSEQRLAMAEKNILRWADGHLTECIPPS